MKIGKYVINFRAYKISDYIYGLGSAVDGKHVLFMDLDDYEYDNAIKDLIKASNKFKIGDIELLESSEKNYHAICLEKFDFGKIIDIHREIGTDIRHDIESLKKGQWFLRASNKNNKQKPKHILTIKSPYNQREKSNAHRLFLQSNYGIKITKKKKGWDNHKSILLNKYQALLKII